MCKSKFFCNTKFDLMKEDSYYNMGYNDCINYYKRYLLLGIDKLLYYLNDNNYDDSLINTLFFLNKRELYS